jgi:hypothetical protein
MTFVIRSKIEEEGYSKHSPHSGKVVDVEPYNYIFNKSTAFLDGNFVKVDYPQLHTVLQTFEERDPDLLELLHYTQEIQDVKKIEQLQTLGAFEHFGQLTPERQRELNSAFHLFERHSPLHMAIQEGNNRSVDIILEYMAKIDTNCSRQFRGIFDKLVEYNKLKTYLNLLTTQTQQMKKKQVLRIQSPVSSEIVAMKESATIYVDQDFYTNQMGEELGNSGYGSYPVNVTAVRLGWIIYSEDGNDGRKFLQEIRQNEDLTFYNLSSLRMIIEFLYQNIKMRFMTTLLPIYLSNLASFFALAVVNEAYRDNLTTDLGEDRIRGSVESKRVRAYLVLLIVLNSICTGFQTYFNY